MGKHRESHTDWIEADLTREIIAAFYTVFNFFGFGLLESVYADALAIELRARGLRIEREVPVEVIYLGLPAGRFRLDMVVEGRVMVECKASEYLSPTARPQVFNYLKIARHPVALLLHFGPKPKAHRFVKPGVLPQASLVDEAEHDQGRNGRKKHDEPGEG